VGRCVGVGACVGVCVGVAVVCVCVCVCAHFMRRMVGRCNTGSSVQG